MLLWMKLVVNCRVPEKIKKAECVCFLLKRGASLDACFDFS